ncbi:hypothetical protein ACWDTI_07220 [Gordonia sp. NPDC003424]
MTRHSLRTTAVLLATGIVSATTVFASAAAAGAPVRDSPAIAGERAPADLDTPAGRTVAALVSGHPTSALDVLPPGFTARFGYRPPVRNGYPIDPRGSCSSPIPLPGRFENLCATHDFGYDLLRYAGEHGHPLRGWARRDLDRQLVSRMRAACSSPVCDAAAIIADRALDLNTWRQHDGPPVDGESPGHLIATTVSRCVEAAVDGRPGLRR